MEKKVTKAQRKIRTLLERYSQRELSAMTQVPQSGICLIAAGKRRKVFRSTRRKFEPLGVLITDWD